MVLTITYNHLPHQKMCATDQKTYKNIVRVFDDVTPVHMYIYGHRDQLCV